MKSLSQRVDWVVYLVIERTSFKQSESSLWPRVKSGICFLIHITCVSQPMYMDVADMTWLHYETESSYFNPKYDFTFL